jgi:hypothetical protein
MKSFEMQFKMAARCALAGIVALAAACSEEEQSASTAAAPQLSVPASMPAAFDPGIEMPAAQPIAQAPAMTPGADGRYDFKVLSMKFPEDWTPEPPSSSMRIAQFALPSPDGAQGEAVATVFFFPPGQGGSAQANIDRWIGQVAQPDGGSSRDKAILSKKQVENIEISTLDVSGAIAASMMGQPQEGSRMLAVIAATPSGSIVVKAVGPESSIASQTEAFAQMIESIR